MLNYLTDAAGITECEYLIYDDFEEQYYCNILVDLADLDCNDNPIYWDKDTVTNIIKHEIGHVLGLDHSSDENHLMYSPDDGLIDFDDLGYVIPDRTEWIYVGYKEINTDYELLDSKLSREQSKYDEYYKQYEYYEGKTLNQNEYQKAQKMYDNLNSQREKINTIVEDVSIYVDKMNCFADKTNRYDPYG